MIDRIIPLVSLLLACWCTGCRADSEPRRAAATEAIEAVAPECECSIPAGDKCIPKVVTPYCTLLDGTNKMLLTGCDQGTSVTPRCDVVYYEVPFPCGPYPDCAGATVTSVSCHWVGSGNDRYCQLVSFEGYVSCYPHPTTDGQPGYTGESQCSPNAYWSDPDQQWQCGGAGCWRVHQNPGTGNPVGCVTDGAQENGACVPKAPAGTAPPVKPTEIGAIGE
jgi:hypothetical protein